MFLLKQQELLRVTIIEIRQIREIRVRNKTNGIREIREIREIRVRNKTNGIRGIRGIRVRRKAS